MLQRVTWAQVNVGDESIARIGRGLAVLVAVERNDAASDADRLLERLLSYRVFADQEGKMNLNLEEVRGELLLVPQFTLAADTRKGTRASFSEAAAPSHGRALFENLVANARSRYAYVASGSFGANMRLSLENDGPVTFILRTPAARRESK